MRPADPRVPLHSRLAVWPLGALAWWLGALLASAATPPAAPTPAASGATLEFNRDIRPILSDNCFACHGFDPKKRKAGLRLDVPEGAYGPGKSGKVAIQRGKPEASELWQRLVTTTADDQMPPQESHKTLTAEQKELLRRWIEQGAGYQRHWAFEPPVRRPAPPTPANFPASAVRNPIDAFLVARLAQEGLAPSPEAERETLIRRVTFDLTGLPPTPAEVDAFLADTSAGAYERVVNRLLNSPRYGEEMARHWLDVARYADTHGLHLDNERQIWPYRDWVVASFNRNQRFDAFTIEQLAGDLLPNPTQDQLIATGFNRNNVTTSEGGSIDAEFIYRYAVDRAATTAQAWLGLTAGCAVCHDHKFDPISTKEFYGLYAFFNSAADPAMDGNVLLTQPVLKLTRPEHQAELDSLDRQIQQAEEAVAVESARSRYTDPATLADPPPARNVEHVWADDLPPAGWKVTASPGASTQFATNDTATGFRVFSGERALRRQDKGLAQDVFEAGPEPLELPPGARLFAYVRIDPRDPPRALMLQYRTSEWKHRAVWGDYDAIDWGARGTTERVLLGPLPASNAWVRLEIDATQVGLQPGDKITGFAVTQFGGTVYWDKIGVGGRIDPAKDPAHSFTAWIEQNRGKEPKQYRAPIPSIFKNLPPGPPTGADLEKLRTAYLSRVCADTKAVFEPLLVRVGELLNQRNAVESRIPSTFVWKDLDQPRESFVMMRGAYDKPGEKVTPGVPAALPPLATTNRPTRLDLARWLVSDDQPLTARVTVNRLWLQFFGMGLVKTAGDFGSQGQPPSHPELLDWLAVTYRDSGWDTKAMVRLMVTSAAYRQSARVTPEHLARDPGNRLYARGPRFRLAAEQIRDNALFVSGLLVPDMGGQGVKPYQPPNIWEPVGFVGSNTREYRQDSGPALYRRSLYTFLKRTAPPPFMSAFDAPNREQFCTYRERSNTPLQALQLMNDIQHFEAARALAQRMLVEGGSRAEDRLVFGFRTVLSRLPAAEEVRVVRAALDAHLARYRRDPAAANEVIHVGESQPRADLAAPELAAYTLAANLLLNLDETVTRN